MVRSGFAPLDLIKYKLALGRARSADRFPYSLACSIEVRHPEAIIFFGKFRFFSFLNVLGVWGECSFISFFIWVVVLPLFVRFAPIGFVLFFRLIWFIFIIDCKVRCKGFAGMRVPSEIPWYSCLVEKLFIGVHLPGLFFWVSHIRVATE